MTVETLNNEDFPLLEKVHEGYVPDPNYSRAIAMEIGKVRNRSLKLSEKAKEIIVSSGCNLNSEGSEGIKVLEGP